MIMVNNLWLITTVNHISNSSTSVCNILLKVKLINKTFCNCVNVHKFFPHFYTNSLNQNIWTKNRYGTQYLQILLDVFYRCVLIIINTITIVTLCLFNRKKKHLISIGYLSKNIVGYKKLKNKIVHFMSF